MLVAQVHALFVQLAKDHSFRVDADESKVPTLLGDS